MKTNIITRVLGICLLTFGTLSIVRADSPDSKFLIQAASANQLEIQAGNLAASRATSSDWKQFGQEMAKDHTSALTQIQTLAVSKSVTLPTDLSPKDASVLQSLQSKQGSAFDQAYESFALKSHRQASRLYSREIAKGQDSDVRNLATQQLPTVQDHLTMVHKMEQNQTLGGNNPTGSGSNNSNSTTPSSPSNSKM